MGLRRKKRAPFSHDPEKNFLSRVRHEGDCIVWTGSRIGNGYSQFRVHGKQVLVHRYAWERVNGPIPDGMFIDHICHNRTCVKIDHLRLASSSENLSNRKGPHPTSKSGARNVSFHQGRWAVRVTKNRKPHYFGSYDTLDEAKEVAQRAREEMFGEFAGRG